MRINSKYDYIVQLLKIIENSSKKDLSEFKVNFNGTQYIKKEKNFADIFVKENKVKKK